MTSFALYPNIVSARRLKERMVPSAVAVMTASKALSRTAGWRASFLRNSSSARLRLVMSRTEARITRLPP